MVIIKTEWGGRWHIRPPDEFFDFLLNYERYIIHTWHGHTPTMYVWYAFNKCCFFQQMLFLDPKNRKKMIFCLFFSKIFTFFNWINIINRAFKCSHMLSESVLWLARDILICKMSHLWSMYKRHIFEFFSSIQKKQKFWTKKYFCISPVSLRVCQSYWSMF